MPQIIFIYMYQNPLSLLLPCHNIEILCQISNVADLVKKIRTKRLRAVERNC